MASGTVVTVVPDKGFGFIREHGSTEKRNDVFFHYRSLSGGLLLDDRLLQREVTFTEGTDDSRGRRAILVEPLN